MTRNSLKRKCPGARVLFVGTSSYIGVQDQISTSSDLSVFSYNQLKLSGSFYSNSKVGENNVISLFLSYIYCTIKFVSAVVSSFVVETAFS